MIVFLFSLKYQQGVWIFITVVFVACFLGVVCSNCGCSTVDVSNGSPGSLIASSVAASSIPPSSVTGDIISPLGCGAVDNSSFSSPWSCSS